MSSPKIRPNLQKIDFVTIIGKYLTWRIIMADTRKKASMSQVLVDIKSYITKG